MTKGETLSVFCLVGTIEEIKASSLRKKSKYEVKDIVSVEMGGSNEQIIWKQEDIEWVISKPAILSRGFVQVPALTIEFC